MALSPSPTYKIVLLGDSGVGKSSIVQRLIEGTFSSESFLTCGGDFYSHQLPVNNEVVNLQIWDTAGQERFRSISKSYFRAAVGAILVYSITSLTSFDELAGWLLDLQNQAAPNAYILLVGNKADLERQREVSVDLVRDFSKVHRLDAIETSALSGMNVIEAFARLSLEVSARIKAGIITVSPSAHAPEQTGKEVETKTCCQ
jgi:small GTP-binding protein